MSQFIYRSKEEEPQIGDWVTIDIWNDISGIDSTNGVLIGRMKYIDSDEFLWAVEAFDYGDQVFLIKQRNLKDIRYIIAK